MGTRYHNLRIEPSEKRAGSVLWGPIWKPPLQPDVGGVNTEYMAYVIGRPPISWPHFAACSANPPAVGTAKPLIGRWRPGVAVLACNLS